VAQRITAGDIARLVEGNLEGDASVAISGLAGLSDAGPGDVTFLANPRYETQVAGTRASVVIVGHDWQGKAPCAVVRVKDPDFAFAKLATTFAPPSTRPEPGVHRLACVAKGVQLGADVSIGPFCVIEQDSRVGDRTVLYAGCYIGRGASVGADCVFYPHVSLREGVHVGNRVVIHNGSVIGSDGFGYAKRGEAWVKIPQIGTVEVGDDVEIGANTTIDRARFGKTVIGNDVKLDNLVQVAHNVRIGDHTAMAAQVGIAGSAVIGKNVQLGGQAGVAGHLTVGDNSVVGGQGGVTKDVAPGTFVSGYPAMPHDKALEIHAHMMRIPKLKERVAELERRIAGLEARLPRDG